MAQSRMKAQNAIASAASGALLGVGFLIPFTWPLAFVGLVLFLWRIQRFSRGMFGSFVQGWLLGLTLLLFALYGIFWHTLPVDWYGFSSPWVQVVAVGGSWFLTSAVLALGTGIFGLTLRWAWRDSAVMLVTIPALWVLCEWLGSFVFSILSAGPGSLISAHFTLGYLGYLLANDLVLLQAAWLGGVYVLSFIIVAVNILLYRLLVANPSERIILLGMSVILAGIYISGHMLLQNIAQDDGSTRVDIAAVSTYAPPKLHLTREEEQQRSEHIHSLLRDLSFETDVIVLPESATFFRNLPEERSLEISALIIDSENIAEADNLTSSYTFFRYTDAHTERSSKQFLLPLGEYMPYLYRTFLLLVPSEFRAQVLSTRSFASGGEVQFARAPDAFVAVRFCNEAMSPYFYSLDSARGANVLVNLSSHSWYHGSRLVHRQMQTVAKVRAVESRRWYVQSGNMAPAFALDAYGRVVRETEWGIPQVLSVSVEKRDDITLYVRLVRAFDGS